MVATGGLTVFLKFKEANVQNGLLFIRLNFIAAQPLKC